MEQEREQAELSSYEFGSMDVFLDVHEAVYGYLAKTNASGASLTFAEWADQRPELDPGIAADAQDQVSDLSTVWHRNLDETAAALSEEGADTDIFLMDHAMRLRFEARHAAVQEYRRKLHDPKLRADSLLASALLRRGHQQNPGGIRNRRFQAPQPGKWGLVQADRDGC